MTPNCDKPPLICRMLHRAWWAKHGSKRKCMSCRSCWDTRECPGQDTLAVPERRINEGKDNEVRLTGLPAILEGTDQFRIKYNGQVVRVTLLERIGPMVKCRWIKDGKTAILCVHKNTVIDQDAARLGRLGGEETELIWESDGKKLCE